MSDRRIHRVRIVNVRLKPECEPRVTHHALLRYAERVYGFDLEKATAWLSQEPVRKAILHGADAVVIGDFKICLKGNAVVTVLGRKQKVKQSNKVLRAFSELANA